MRQTHKANLALIARIAIGCLMLWAGLIKVVNPHDFLVAIYAYEIPLPELIFRLTAIILPWLEVLCGLALVAGVWQPEFLGLLSFLGLIFILITGQAWLRGLDISCGCFGSKLERNTFLGSVAFAFLRNLALFYAVFYLWLRSLVAAEEKTLAS